jgi:hypothetical protein
MGSAACGRVDFTDTAIKDGNAGVFEHARRFGGERHDHEQLR